MISAGWCLIWEIKRFRAEMRPERWNWGKIIMRFEGPLWSVYSHKSAAPWWGDGGLLRLWRARQSLPASWRTDRSLHPPPRLLWPRDSKQGNPADIFISAVWGIRGCCGENADTEAGRQTPTAAAILFYSVQPDDNRRGKLISAAFGWKGGQGEDNCCEAAQNRFMWVAWPHWPWCCLGEFPRDYFMCLWC